MVPPSLRAASRSAAEASPAAPPPPSSDEPQPASTEAAVRAATARASRRALRPLVINMDFPFISLFDASRAQAGLPEPLKEDEDDDERDDGQQGSRDHEVVDGLRVRAGRLAAPLGEP